MDSVVKYLLYHVIRALAHIASAFGCAPKLHKLVKEDLYHITAQLVKESAEFTNPGIWEGQSPWQRSTLGEQNAES
jgi:hypothetical protein